MKPKDLDLNVILQKEFDYAAQTAFQANEDRITIFNFFITSIGSLIAGGLLVDMENEVYRVGLSLFFYALSFFGTISILKLIKLRLSWLESVRAMNHIKSYYLQHLEIKESPFRWKESTIPKANKIWSISFLYVVTINLIGSICILIATVILLNNFDLVSSGLIFLSYWIFNLIIFLRNK